MLILYSFPFVLFLASHGWIHVQVLNRTHVRISLASGSMGWLSQGEAASTNLYVTHVNTGAGMVTLDQARLLDWFWGHKSLADDYLWNGFSREGIDTVGNNPPMSVINVSVCFEGCLLRLSSTPWHVAEPQCARIGCLGLSSLGVVFYQLCPSSFSI